MYWQPFSVQALLVFSSLGCPPRLRFFSLCQDGKKRSLSTDAAAPNGPSTSTRRRIVSKTSGVLPHHPVVSGGSDRSQAVPSLPAGDRGPSGGASVVSASSASTRRRSAAKGNGRASAKFARRPVLLGRGGAAGVRSCGSAEGGKKRSRARAPHVVARVSRSVRKGQLHGIPPASAVGG